MKHLILPAHGSRYHNTSKNKGAVKKSATKPVDSLDMEAHGL